MRRFYVRVLSQKKIRDACKGHSEWAASLASWYKITKNADWPHFAAIRQTYRNADKVGACVVFNIGYNKCRLITWINYQHRKVFIRYILSHADYHKGWWKHECECD